MKKNIFRYLFLKNKTINELLDGGEITKEERDFIIKAKRNTLMVLLIIIIISEIIKFFNQENRLFISWIVFGAAIVVLGADYILFKNSVQDK